MGILILIAAAWVITGWLIARYGLRINDGLILPPLAMGIGSVVHFLLLNILLRPLSVALAGWLALVIMLSIGGLCWYFNRAQVLPLSLGCSKKTALSLLIVWGLLGGALYEVKSSMPTMDEIDHAPRTTMIRREGLSTGLLIPAYDQPWKCDFYHYAENAVIAVLSRQSGSLDLVTLTNLRVTYDMLAVLGLCFTLLRLLFKRQYLAWAVIGSLIFISTSPAGWLSLIHDVPSLDRLLPDTAFFETSRTFAQQASLNPFGETKPIPLQYGILFMAPLTEYMSTPNPPGFSVAALLVFIALVGLRGRAISRAVAIGLGVLAATTGLYYTTGIMLVVPSVGIYLLWRLWQTRSTPLAGLVNLALYGATAAVVAVFQGGQITYQVFCEVRPDVIVGAQPEQATALAQQAQQSAPADVPFIYPKDSQGGQALAFGFYLVSPRYFMITGDQVYQVKFTDPSRWFNVLIDWGVPLLLYPFVLMFALRSRQIEVSSILLAGLLSLGLAFFTYFEPAPRDHYRFAILPLWFGSALSVLWLAQGWQKARGAVGWFTRAGIIGVIVILSLTAVVNAVWTARSPRGVSKHLREIDRRVQAEWFGVLDPYEERVWDPNTRFSGRMGTARAIMIFGTYGGKFPVYSNFKAQQFVPNDWDLGDHLPGELIDANYRYLYVDEVWLYQTLPWWQVFNLANPSYYELVEKWKDESSAEERRLYRVVGTTRYDDQYLADNRARLGMSEEAYAQFQAYTPTFDIRPIFNPATGSLALPKDQSLPILGRYVQAATLMAEERANLLDLMKVLENMSYQETLSLPAAEQAALAQWRETKLPQYLREAGFDYLVFDKNWLSYLSSEDYAVLSNPEYYTLVQVWRLPTFEKNAEFFYLYRVVDEKN